jgi:hypothetical protein
MVMSYYIHIREEGQGCVWRIPVLNIIRFILQRSNTFIAHPRKEASEILHVQTSFISGLLE